MAHSPTLPAAPAALPEPGLRPALMFALVAERLSTFYEHGQWLKEAQGTTLATDWLRRSQRKLPSDQLRAISAASDTLARQIASSLSREAGLYVAHEMTEALDPNYASELGQSMMEQCRQSIARLDLPTTDA